MRCGRLIYLLTLCHRCREAIPANLKLADQSKDPANWGSFASLYSLSEASLTTLIGPDSGALNFWKCFILVLVALIMDPRSFTDEKSESRLYVGNLDLRITEAALIKMFSPYGKIISEDFLWHTRGPKRGEPRGFAFIQYSTKEEAKLAKEKMHGRLACGRPLMVHLASEKYSEEAPRNSSKARGEPIKSGNASSVSGQMSRSAKITAIKNKLKALDEERDSAKKQKAR
ncbi:hypothetical protein HRI_005164100 [Hibiscus trionum]|uniref:RRM domain-containing protein n=1 Tax=Hibiscus trionum TaxID=183268 RepID=A0A9W7MTP5_HIBTR|nr:hypothetical protein HRI_005164100 [Hibiscus trionum]